MSKDLIPNAMLTDDAVYLVDYIGGNMILAPDKKQTLLNENSIAKRLQLLAYDLTKPPYAVLVEAVKEGGPGLEILPVHYQIQPET